MQDLKCPICESTNVQMCDSQPLDYSTSQFDSELYATIKCNECKTTFEKTFLISIKPQNHV